MNITKEMARGWVLFSSFLFFYFMDSNLDLIPCLYSISIPPGKIGKVLVLILRYNGMLA